MPEPMEGASVVEQAPTDQTPAASIGVEEIEHLTIAEAKRGLAATFGVPLEAIEITIRA